MERYVITLPDLSGYVPYAGATGNVDIGTYQLRAGNVQVDNLDIDGSTLQSVVAPLYLSCGTTGLYIQFNGSTVAWADSSLRLNVVKTLVIGDGVNDASAIFQDEQTANSVTVKTDKLSGGSATVTFPNTATVGGNFQIGTAPGSSNVPYGTGTNTLTNSKNFQYTEGGGVSSLSVGGAGFDGELKLYSEQGATDYTAALRANTAMTANSTFYFPAAVPGGTRLLTMSSGGVMGYFTGTANRVLFLSSTDTVGSDADFTFATDTLTVTKIAATTYTGNQTYNAGVNFILDATTGSKLGTATTQKLGFWNATPIVQPAAANQAALTNSTGGTYDGTLADVGAAYSQSTLNNNFTNLHTLLNEIRTAIVNSGLMKGSA